MATANATTLAVEGGQPAVDPSELRKWPDITPADHAAVTEALATDMDSASGRNVTALSEEFCEYTGRRYALPVSSGTAACHAALVSAGVQPGDEVIIPALSFVATALAVMWAGARPVVADIRPDTFNIDFDDAARLVTPRTKAVFPVHAHGLLADVGAARRFCRRFRVRLVEDACQAMGAMAHGRKAGSFGLTTAFSLARAKPWTATLGGMVTTDDPDAYASQQDLASLGEQRQATKPGETRSYWCEYLGHNYRLGALYAALARSQLRRLNDYLSRARANLEILRTGVAGIPGLSAPFLPAGHAPSVNYARFVVDPFVLGWKGNPRECCDRIMDALRRENVKVTRWQVNPLSAMPVLRRANVGPWYPGMPHEELTPIDRSLHPVAWSVLDNSFILGEEPYALHVQTPKAMHQIVTGLQKVFDPRNMKIVLRRDYLPIPVVPPIPEPIT